MRAAHLVETEQQPEIDPEAEDEEQAQLLERLVATDDVQEQVEILAVMKQRVSGCPPEARVERAGSRLARPVGVLEQVPTCRLAAAPTSVASIVARKATMPQKIARRDSGIRVDGRVSIAARKGTLPRTALTRHAGRLRP